MSHLKVTFVGLLALTAAASDAFAQGPPLPPMGGPPMGGPRVSRWAAPQVSQWAVASRPPQWAVAYRLPR